MAVMDKQVIWVKREHWQQVKNVLTKNFNDILVGVDLTDLSEVNVGIHCNYFGDISIDDEATGVILTSEGEFIQNYKIISKLISTQTVDKIVPPKAKKVSVNCNLTSKVAPVFWTNYSKMDLNEIQISNVGKPSSFCCISATNLLSS